MIEVKKLQTLCILKTPEPKFYHAHDAEGKLLNEEEAIFYAAWLYNLMFILRLKQGTIGNISHKTEGMVLPQEFRITWFVLGKFIGFQNCPQARGRVRPNNQGTSQQSR